MYGAAFLFLIFLAELPMEQRALGIIPAYRYCFLSFGNRIKGPSDPRELKCQFLPQRHVEISFLQNPFFVSEKHFIFGV
jgi:hypothetical protein